MDHISYPHYAPCQSNLAVASDLHYTTASTTQTAFPENQHLSEEQKPIVLGSSPPQIIQKRKRSVNPQADENFVRALEAVRFGGIGFCKAARMYGVNNRTLWLEYKKRGYPINRLSIKNRKQEFSQQEAQPEVQQQIIQQTQTSSENTATPLVKSFENETMCVTNPVALINTAFLDGRQVEMNSVLQRSRFFEQGLLNTSQPINMGINYDHLS